MCSSLTNHSPPFCHLGVSRFPQYPSGSTAALLNSLDLWQQSRALLSTLVCFSLLSFNTIAPNNKPSTDKKGAVSNRNRSHPPHQFQTEEELSSPDDDQPTMKDVTQNLGVLTTTLVVTNAKVDSLTTHGVPHASTPAEQPGPSWHSAGEKPPATTSTAEPDQTSIEEQVRIWLTQHMRASSPSLLTTTDDESDGEEEEHLSPGGGHK